MNDNIAEKLENSKSKVIFSILPAHPLLEQSKL